MTRHRKPPPDSRPAKRPAPPTTGPRPVAGLVFAAIAAALVVWRASTLTALFWAQDDAYISFRFARNLVRGHGLVFNVGERVEGYTNFLWTVISAIPMALGHADPLHAMQWLGFVLLIVGYATLIGFGLVLNVRMRRFTN